MDHEWIQFRYKLGDFSRRSRLCHWDLSIVKILALSCIFTSALTCSFALNSDTARAQPTDAIAYIESLAIDPITERKREIARKRLLDRQTRLHSYSAPRCS